MFAASKSLKHFGYIDSMGPFRAPHATPGAPQPLTGQPLAPTGQRSRRGRFASAGMGSVEPKVATYVEFAEWLGVKNRWWGRWRGRMDGRVFGGSEVNGRTEEGGFSRTWEGKNWGHCREEQILGRVGDPRRVFRTVQAAWT